jgi:hypothetical protein
VTSASGILKFLDNIVALYAHVGGMVLVVFVSLLFLEFQLTLTFLCGFVVCVVSLYLYHHDPVRELVRTGAIKLDMSGK